MIVTRIIEYNAKKVLVEIDEHLLLPLYLSERRKLKLTEGTTFSQEDFEDLIKTLKKRAKIRAMKLLEARSYSSFSLREKLKADRYPEEIIEEAIAYVGSYGYVDDIRYASEYIHAKADVESERIMQQKLYRKGISNDIFTQAFENFKLENSYTKEEEQIERLLRKKGFDPSASNEKERLKIMQFLYRKGYSAEIIAKCIKMNSFLGDMS